jgi:Ca2+-binding EF-hand superfamily protein
MEKSYSPQKSESKFLIFFPGIKFAFEVYDFKGDGKVDGFYIGDLLRACNLNPTLKTINELGGETDKGKRTLKIDEFYAIFKKAKDSKDTGGFHDFVEILKLYDKNEDCTILENELFRLLTNLGETSETTNITIKNIHK